MSIEGAKQIDSIMLKKLTYSSSKSSTERERERAKIESLKELYREKRMLFELWASESSQCNYGHYGNSKKPVLKKKSISLPLSKRMDVKIGLLTRFTPRHRVNETHHDVHNKLSHHQQIFLGLRLILRLNLPDPNGAIPWKLPSCTLRSKNQKLTRD